MRKSNGKPPWLLLLIAYGGTFITMFVLHKVL